MKKLTIILTFLILTACGSDDKEAPVLAEVKDVNCQIAMDAVVAELGPPVEIDKYDAADYHNWSFWYWSKGTSRTFIWGANIDSCQVSSYSFQPF